MPDTRLLTIKDAPFDGSSVVYVMARDQRAQDNHALITAQNLAIVEKVPLFVLFVLTPVKSRSREHYSFMLEGLREVSERLQSNNISFILRSGDKADIIGTFAKEVDSGAVFFDFSPLKNARSVVKKVAGMVDAQVAVVDTHNIIPLWVASDKQEFAAHTMRRKVHRHLDTFLVAPSEIKNHPHPADTVDFLSFTEAENIIQSLPSSGISLRYTPGEKAAQAQLTSFIESDLEHYAQSRNNIAKDSQSGLSPYLHFGQISSLRVAVETISHVNETPLLFHSFKLAQSDETPSSIDGMNALLEEIIVRKELSDNFCFYSESYMSVKGAPEWARKSLADHATDPRDFIYTVDEWESCRTHDAIWNSAQMELNKTGKMHGYLRMYWAKKILEWSASPEEALHTAIYLNDKYSIDGGDPNGYVGILWSIAGLHDRPWFECAVFGKVRYMNEAGLRRKYDVDAYIQHVKEL